MRYCTKPSYVDAILWDGNLTSIENIQQLVGDQYTVDVAGSMLYIGDQDGLIITVDTGEYVLVSDYAVGHMSSFKFNQTYQLVK